MEAIARNDYAARHAPAGWLYAARFESRFIDAELVPLPVRRHARPTNESVDLAGAAASQLARLGGMSGVAQLYTAMKELVGATYVDGVEPSRLFADHDTLNIVIIGAGPIGLALASALRLAVGAHAKVLVVESRVDGARRKRAYERRWLTAIGHDVLATIVETPVRDLFARVGTDKIGVTIDVFETLLLLSCRRLGVRFLFDAHPDLSFIGDRPVHLVVDATGNRLQASVPGEVSIGPPISTEELRVNDRRLASYGVDLGARSPYPSIHVASAGTLKYPLYEGRRIAQAMLEIRQLPARICRALVESVVGDNHDNKHYIWRGSLREEINQGLVLVNLSRTEYDALCAYRYPRTIAETIASGALDARTVGLLARVIELASVEELAQVEVDAPFIWQPYWIEDHAARLHDKTLVRVGDSIYTGNVKLANGLSPHLRHVAHVQKALWEHAAAGRAALIARTMGLARSP